MPLVCTESNTNQISGTHFMILHRLKYQGATVSSHATEVYCLMLSQRGYLSVTGQGNATCDLAELEFRTRGRTQLCCSAVVFLFFTSLPPLAPDKYTAFVSLVCTESNLVQVEAFVKAWFVRCSVC
jgi:hypothetical protein